MHYYQFNIGDYTSHTARLSLFEDLAYRRMLDLYYLNERPFNGCSTDVARDIGMCEQQPQVDYILAKYFEKDGDLWRNKRADNAISEYHKKLKTASKAGKASAKARQVKASERTLNERTAVDEPTINHKPITTNQEPVVHREKAKRFVPPTIQDVTLYCSARENTVDPERFIDHYTSNGWKVGKNSMKDWKASVRTWEKGNNNEKSNNNAERLIEQTYGASAKNF